MTIVDKNSIPVCSYCKQSHNMLQEDCDTWYLDYYMSNKNTDRVLLKTYSSVVTEYIPF